MKKTDLPVVPLWALGPGGARAAGAACSGPTQVWGVASNSVFMESWHSFVAPVDNQQIGLTHGIDIAKKSCAVSAAQRPPRLPHGAPGPRAPNSGHFWVPRASQGPRK